MVLKIDFQDGAVLVWRVTPDGVTAERVADYTPTICVHAEGGSLDDIRPHLRTHPQVAATARTHHRPGFRHEAAPMLRVDVTDVGAITDVARQIQQWDRPGAYRLFDVDLSPEFRYCLETGTEPTPTETRELECLRLAATEADLATNPLPRLTVGEQVIEGPDTIIETVTRRLHRTDPDILVVSAAALVPRLFELADRVCNRSFQLGRRPGYQQRAGRSTYTSYGQVGHSPARYSVPGRVLINEQHSFMWSETNLAGCLDLVERSGKPLQELGWASIGNILTAIQIREARERDVRVPWNSWRHEFFKSMRTLHEADRGGFTFEPEVGIHEDVHELDFSSMYPNIMVTRNISPETVCCDCHTSDDVPGLDYSICDERGYLADVLKPIIDDRAAIKAELQTVDDLEREQALQGRSAALKWILVSCFGYQGFSNAKFGRIECHEAINAVAREILLDAKELLEANGWRVVHGIVDSLWVTAMADREQTPLEEVCETVSEAIAIDLEHEAAYDWIAFVPQRTSDAGALTKYFGKEAGINDRYKYRGIECRQRSTSAYVDRVQRGFIQTYSEHREPQAVCDILQRRLDELNRGAVDARELLITQRVSKPLEEYEQRTRSVSALRRAESQGIGVHPGESIEYLVANDATHSRDRVRLAFEVTAETAYDASFYRERLLRAAESVLSPTGWRESDIEAYLADRSDASLRTY
ncbi:type B DNA-directed DNA polymerase [Haloglomus litoreum]|uniref:type B DNA-directed DNA polymerase n=1 Tax=Haloglomus litoreum TaxID=3034026 RepID=UPI0023E8F1F0|nr:type B DNA-directed DNA polymerase [Haloglomus sp. DT116]